MKKLLIIATLIFSSFSFAQDSLSIRKTKVIAFSPKKFIADNANGINFGILDEYDHQKINGINFQLNPFVLIYPLLPKGIDVPTEQNATVTVNGLSISTGGMTDGKKLNGIAISAYHHAMITNGISANFYNNTSGKLNGIHVSGFANNSDKGAGITVAAMGNYSENFSGIQLAFFNEAKSMKGVQIGLSNKSDKLKGLQVGLWNKNGKRSLPIFNF